MNKKGVVVKFLAARTTGNILHRSTMNYLCITYAERKMKFSEQDSWWRTRGAVKEAREMTWCMLSSEKAGDSSSNFRQARCPHYLLRRHIMGRCCSCLGQRVLILCGFVAVHVQYMKVTTGHKVTASTNSLRQDGNAVCNMCTHCIIRHGPIISSLSCRGQWKHPNPQFHKTPHVCTFTHTHTHTT